MKHCGATCPGLQINRPKNGIDDRGGGKEMGWSQKKNYVNGGRDGQWQVGCVWGASWHLRAAWGCNRR